MRVGVPQVEVLSAHSLNNEDWADERDLAISVPKSTITLLNPEFAQPSNHPQVTLNHSILPLERPPCVLGVTLDPHLKFNAHVKSLVTRASPIINVLNGTKYQLGSEEGNHTPHLYIHYQVSFHV